MFGQPLESAEKFLSVCKVEIDRGPGRQTGTDREKVGERKKIKR